MGVKCVGNVKTRTVTLTGGALEAEASVHIIRKITPGKDNREVENYPGRQHKEREKPTLHVGSARGVKF